MLTIVEACPFCPDWEEELFCWAITLAVPLDLGDWWNENFFFAQSCSSPDFVCFSMFPLWAKLTPSVCLSKLSTTNPRKSVALASTRICCKYWVHIWYVTFTTLSSLSTSLSKSLPQHHLLNVFFERVSFFFFFEGGGLLLFIFTVKIVNLKTNFMIKIKKLTANSLFTTFNYFFFNLLIWFLFFSI